MNFKYTVDRFGQPNPMLRVHVTGTRRTTRLTMLVDSGGDWTIVPPDVADWVGYKPTDQRVELASFTGEKTAGAMVTGFGFRFGDFHFRGRAIVHPQAKVPLLGTNDFFLRYRVTFDASAGLFYVNAADRGDLQ